MASIEQLLSGLLEREGGYVNHPNDRGGPTNFGITEHVARAYGYKGDMRLLPKTTALDIYRAQYWTGPGFDYVASRMPKLAEELFDTGVNMGPKVAATFLQIALNAFNRNQADYPDIPEDGDIGRLTLYSLDRLKAKRPDAEKILLRAVDAQQGARYLNLGIKNKTQEAFMYGWFANRVGA